MASFTIKSLQQEQLIPFTLSRYHFSLNISNFHYFPHSLTPLPLKTNHNRKFSPEFVVKSQTSVPKFGTLERQSSVNTENVKERKEIGHGFSSAKSIDKRVKRNLVKNHVNSVVEEESEKGFSRRTRKTLSYRHPTSSSKSLETSSNITVNEKMDKRVSKNIVKNHVNSVVEEDSEKGFSRHTRKTPSYREKRGGSSLETSSNITVSEKIEKKENGNKVVKGKRVRSKKDKDSPEVKLRVAFDMCSKRGDVMEALSLYDRACREGVKLGQHHYTVLLYLCSSAAVGVVQPAKSGSGSRTLSTLAISNEILNPLESSGSIDKNDKDISNSNTHILDDMAHSSKEDDGFSVARDGTYNNREDRKILVSEDVKEYALKRGLEVYENMRVKEVPMNEAALTSMARIAMAMGDGDMAFEMVKQMKILGINPRLRSYDPALFTFCNNGDLDKAFSIEKHMFEHGVIPEEPELAALLRVSIVAGKGEKVYYVLHKLRTIVREVSTSTVDLIISWFKSKLASRVGKRKWDKKLIKEVMENNGGGWHGQGWLGKGQWEVFHTTVGTDGMCKCCGVHLATIDLDPIETEKFANSVASFAIMREKKSNFQKFQRWLDYYGPFEAVVDAANVGLFSQRRFMPSKINAVVNGIRQKLPSKKYPLIILHNKRITGNKMDEPINKELIEKWKNSDALYATPTGSNDDWYWLYAAIKFRCLIVTNDEMRDHIFQLLGNDIFPKWKERHQVHFSFSETGPEFHMPPPCSVVIQESEEGHWHIPVKSEDDFKSERRWLCISRAESDKVSRQSSTRSEDSQLLQDGECARPSSTLASETELLHMNHGNQKEMKEAPQNMYKNLRDMFSASVSSDHRSTILSDIEAAEFFGGCTIDFQI